jgi:hypothetical protein
MHVDLTKLFTILEPTLLSLKMSTADAFKMKMHSRKNMATR